MSWRVEETDNKITVYLAEQSQTVLVRKELGSICNRARETGKRLVLDFRGIQFMSSANIGTIVLLNKYAKTHAVVLRLANVTGNVLEVFKITRLDKVFRFDDGDDDFEFLGGLVPRPKRPDSDSGHSETPES